MNVYQIIQRGCLSGIALLCFFLLSSVSDIYSQQLTPIEGDKNPCPGVVRYDVTAQGMWCNIAEYEITIQQMDANGNIVDLGSPIGTAALVWYSSSSGGSGDYTVTHWEFDVTWAVPPSTQYDRAILCFRTRCTETPPDGGTFWDTQCCTVRVKTIDALDISGPTSYECCVTDPLTFCATPSSLSTYDWNVPSGWTVQGASNGACITVIPDGSNGDVTVQPYHDDCNRWGPITSQFVSTTTCTSGEIEVVNLVPCNGASEGSLRAVAPAGFSISSISWRDQNGNLVGTTETISGLPPGTYTATMTLSNGCTAIETIELTDPANDDALDVDFDISVYDASGWAGETSNCWFHVVANVSGGTPPYSYDWNSYPSNDNLTYLNVEGSTTVNVTITDARGCTRTFTVSTPACIGGGGVTDITSLGVSPNPNNGSFTTTVGLDNGGDLDINIHDIYNNLVYTYNAGQVSAGSHSYSVDITGRVDGTYFLTATLDGAGPVTVQVIKQ